MNLGKKVATFGGAATAAHNQAWSTITSTPTTLSGYGITDAQGMDADLTALAGLSANGLIAHTGSGTAAARTITGTANQVIVTNGDGVNGNPTLSLPQSIATTSSPVFAGVYLPAGGKLSFSAEAFFTTEDNVQGAYLKTPGGYKIEAANGMQFLVAGVPKMTINSAGSLSLLAYGAGTLVTDSSGNVTASSDARLKNVTGSFTRGLSNVLKLTPRTYRWNVKSGMNTDDENVGFIAQEVLDAIPEAVGQYRTSEVEVDGKKTKKREKAELLTLSDRPIIAALVNAVKELKADNDALRARVSALEKGKASK